MELILAMTLTVSLAIAAIYLSMPKDEASRLQDLMARNAQFKTSWDLEKGNVKEIIKENIVGELRKGSFEEVIEDLRNLTFYYGGRMPYLNMIYENGLWNGWITCKLPTENVTSFTFDVRDLINRHGEVTHISINIMEEEVNQTGELPPETQFSDVTISLKEFVEGESPILSQLETVVSYLTTALLWIVQGVILGVPLCFASLGAVMLVDRVIIPVWKRQLKGKSLNKSTA